MEPLTKVASSESIQIRFSAIKCASELLTNEEIAKKAGLVTVSSIMRSLYKLVEFRHRVDETVILLALFRDRHLQVFSDVIEESFAAVDPEEREKAIKIFVSTWALLEGRTSAVGIETMVGLL